MSRRGVLKSAAALAVAATVTAPRARRPCR
ncbi:twin-arginine translocation signal domain-containing protein [Streptomyces sp. NPDC005921]